MVDNNVLILPLRKKARPSQKKNRNGIKTTPSPSTSTTYEKTEFARTKERKYEEKIENNNQTEESNPNYQLDYSIIRDLDTSASSQTNHRRQVRKNISNTGIGLQNGSL